MEDQDHVLNWLRLLTGAHEVYEVITYSVWRKNKQDESQHVTVKVYDAGPNSVLRYYARAESDDGKQSTDNPDKSITAALGNVHWNNLDAEPAA
jgi:hypothetical protein